MEQYVVVCLSGDPERQTVWGPFADTALAQNFVEQRQDPSQYRILSLFPPYRTRPAAPWLGLRMG